MSLDIEMVGHRILIKQDKVETTTESGIIVQLDNDEFKRYEGAITTGVMVDYGPTAWTDPGLRRPDGSPWAERGDRVGFAKYAGSLIVDEETGDKYQLMNDEDLQYKVRV